MVKTRRSKLEEAAAVEEEPKRLESPEHRVSSAGHLNGPSHERCELDGH